MRSTARLATLLAALAGCGTPASTTSDGPPSSPPDLAALDAAADGAIEVCSPACGGLTPKCNASRHCVGCLGDTDCPAGSYCKIAGDSQASCVPGCTDDGRCGAGEKCCGHACVDPSSDLANCGGCGTACTSIHAAPACHGGQCGFSGQCDPGWGDCNNDPKDGCEANLHVDPNNCTACAMACVIPGAIAACADGCYPAACEFGFDNCDNDPMGACQTSVLSDVMNCGACGHSCTNLPNASALCQNANCVLGGCNPGFADCDGMAADGCESNLATDGENCGACGNSCPQGQVCMGGACTCPQCNNAFPNASANCVNGQCVFSQCNLGFANCDGNPKNGCEVNVASDSANCGVCANSCPQNTPSCGAGVCTNLWTPVGIQTNVPVAQLAGWTLCYHDTYDVHMVTPPIIQACTGSKLMLACRRNNAQTLDLVAWAPRADVLFDTQHGNNGHLANNVQWYYNATWSWGFAGPGEALARNECDTNGGADRLCWHTGIDAGGYRCGDNSGLNDDATWDRLVYQAN